MRSCSSRFWRVTPVLLAILALAGCSNGGSGATSAASSPAPSPAALMSLPPPPSKKMPTEAQVRRVPRTASPQDYCAAEVAFMNFKPTPANSLAYTWYQVKIGVPADMPAQAFEGYVADVSDDYYLDHHNQKLLNKQAQALVKYDGMCGALWPHP